MKRLFTALLLPACMLAAISHAGSSSGEDEGYLITALLKSRFDKPEALLQVAPVSIVSDHALVGWVQGENGGRALLQKLSGKWQLQLCGGDGLKQESVLIQAGIEPSQAHDLATKAVEAEAALPAVFVRKLSRFSGTMTMAPEEAAH